MINSLPKIDLHCHLDGSVRPETIIDLAKKENVKLFSYDIDEIKKAMIAPFDCKSLNEYLERFKLPNDVMQSKESLKRITFELLEDASKENVKYMEIRFAPMLHTLKGLTISEVIQSVIDGIKLGEDKYDIKANLILSAMRNMGKNSAEILIEEGEKFLNNYVVAIDLCGPEDEGFVKEFIEPIKKAREYGYRVTIHAGETGYGSNVLDAVELLGAERIGHGIFITNCKEAYDIVKEKGITLETCPTSNVQTKAVKSFEGHPFYDFYKNGINVTINTDNRTVSNIDMTNECKIAFDKFNIKKDEYKDIYLKTVEATFTCEETKKWLRSLI